MAPQPDGGHAADTNWSALTVGQMWNMVKDHNESPGWNQALAWMRTFELLDYHRLRIQSYRELLVAKWPPERSPAAAAFLTQVDALLASLTQMRDAAMANGPALEQITAGISEARIKLASVHQDWAASQAKLDSYNQQVAATKSGTPAPLPSPPPVPPGQQAALHAQAVTIMSVLGSQALESEAAMKRPPSYVPPSYNSQETAQDLGSGSKPTVETGGHSPSASHQANPVFADYPGPMLSRSPVQVPPKLPDTPSLNVPAGEPIVGSGPTDGSISYPPPVMGRIGSNDEAANQGKTGLAPGDSARDRRASSYRRVSGSTQQAAPEWEPSATKPRTANPVGGVIGPKSRPEFGEIAGGAVGSGSLYGRQSGRRERGRTPDQSWSVRGGVPQTLMPPEETTSHDPGPIIGPHP
jgi:hypothetical protein